jgi:putative sterol carrier protein
VSPKTIKEFFSILPQKLDPDAAEGILAVYQFDLSGPQGGQYHVVIENGACSVREGMHAEPHVTFSMADDDCLNVLNGHLDGPAVFMSGRLRVRGDLGIALQLKALFPSIGSS